MGDRRRRWFLGVAAACAVALFVLVPGFATGLGWSTRSVGANRATVAQCDSDGVGVIQNLSGANVVSVTVSGIAAGCAGGTLSVAVDNATANGTGTATVPAGGGALTVPLGSAVAAKDGEEIDVAISGP